MAVHLKNVSLIAFLFLLNILPPLTLKNDIIEVKWDVNSVYVVFKYKPTNINRPICKYLNDKLHILNPWLYG